MVIAVCGMLRGDLQAQHLSEGELQAAWEYATAASADELLAQALTDTASGVPPSLAPQIAARLRDAHAREMMRASMLRGLDAAFGAAGLRALLMKGAGLAYTLYPSPHLRPSDDVDVLIDAGDLAAAEQALEGAGYARQLEPDVGMASTQRHYTLALDGGFERIVDLHWAVANRRAFSEVVSFEQAWPASRSVPGLTHARTLGPVDALLLACTHRVAHHGDSPSLLWLWDIHLLASTLNAGGMAAVAERAVAARVAAVVAHSLRLAHERFATPVDPVQLARLDGATGEPSARFINGARRPVDWLVSDLEESGSLAGRLRLVGEHVLPPLTYMRKRYPALPVALLPLAYVYRALRGAPRWFRR